MTRAQHEIWISASRSAVVASLCVLALGAAACASAPTPSSPGSRSAGTPRAGEAAATPTPLRIPPYSIAALRTRPPAHGAITVGTPMGGGPGYGKYNVTWTSDGSTMTGVLDVPSGSGKFPVVIVNHGYAPVSQYYVGLDTAKYADPMASAGFLTISPAYPGYLGSGPGAPGVPSIVAEAISDIDLISELPTLPQADPNRVAVAGHSNGGGVAEILMAADTRVRAAVLWAPVSSDFADDARKWWARTPGGSGGLPSPDVNPTVYRWMSPRSWFTKDTPPTLIMQGTQDEQIPAEWTAATVQALQSVGAKVQFISFPGATHIFEDGDLDRSNILAIDWLRASLG